MLKGGNRMALFRLPASGSFSQPEISSSLLPGNFSSRSWGPAEWCVVRGPLEPCYEEGASFCWTEVTQCWAGPLTCGHGFPKPQGAHQGNAHVPWPYHLLTPKGDFISAIVSTVAVGSQVPRTSLRKRAASNVLPFTSSDSGGGVSSVCRDNFLFYFWFIPYDRLNDLS